MSLPPSYQEATSRSIPALLAPCLDNLDVASLALLCRMSKEWREELSPKLWWDPLRIIAMKPGPFGKLSTPILFPLLTA